MSEEARNISPSMNHDLLCCHYCGEASRAYAKLKRCSGCELVMYCSKECQRRAWPEHKAVCRSKPTEDSGSGSGDEAHDTREDGRARFRKSLGYPTVASLSRALNTWIHAHRWSLMTTTKAAVLLAHGLGCRHLDPRTPQLIVYTLSPNTSLAPTPATAFGVDSTTFVAELEATGDGPSYRELWEKVAGGRAALDASLRALGDPSFMGVIPAVYALKDAGVVAHIQEPVWWVPPSSSQEPVDEGTAFWGLQDLLELCNCSINCGLSLRPLFEANAMPVPGVVKKERKMWVWEPLFADADDWDAFVTSLSCYKSMSGLRPRALFALVALS
ncbi:hypothetical protein C8Q80DRAFT_1123435 [Daedaleopsis nitida]|nr:hypothetical protein C8Q80DRAFT_1123435 [Daedaleopsis nitida]